MEEYVDFESATGMFTTEALQQAKDIFTNDMADLQAKLKCMDKKFAGLMEDRAKGIGMNENVAKFVVAGAQIGLVATVALSFGITHAPAFPFIMAAMSKTLCKLIVPYLFTGSWDMDKQIGLNRLVGDNLKLEAWKTAKLMWGCQDFLWKVAQAAFNKILEFFAGWGNIEDEVKDVGKMKDQLGALDGKDDEIEKIVTGDLTGKVGDVMSLNPNAVKMPEPPAWPESTAADASAGRAEIDKQVEALKQEPTLKTWSQAVYDRIAEDAENVQSNIQKNVDERTVAIVGDDPETKAAAKKCYIHSFCTAFKAVVALSLR